MQCVLATRPYEKNPGSTDALCDYWLKKLRENITSASLRQYNKYIKEIIHDFDNLPVNKDVQKPRVGVVGEIYVKFHPSANNHINELIEKEGGRSRYIWLARLLPVLCYGQHIPCKTP